MDCQATGTGCRYHLTCSPACPAVRLNAVRRPDLHFTCITECLASQAALLAASTDREAAQAALAEAKMRQDETAEVLHLPMLKQDTPELQFYIRGYMLKLCAGPV